MEVNVLNYRKKILNKIWMEINNCQKILDVGCGDGGDCELLSESTEEIVGIDIELHPNWAEVQKRKCNVDFQIADVCNLPFEDNRFDCVFLHDVLHHIDEEHQSYEKHISGLQEIKRVCKKGGSIIIAEANRYNFLFYPHMVLIARHNHFTQKYFKKILKDIFGENITLKSLEAHCYPLKLLKLFKIFEFFMEHIKILSSFRAYNLAIIKNGK